MKNFYHQDWLLRFASKVFKYFLLSLFGLVVAFLFVGILGFMPLIALLLSLLKQCFMKFAITVLCIVGVAVVMESIR